MSDEREKAGWKRNSSTQEWRREATRTSFSAPVLFVMAGF